MSGTVVTKTIKCQRCGQKGIVHFVPWEFLWLKSETVHCPSCGAVNSVDVPGTVQSVTPDDADPAV